jgi:hypothetical protein
MSLKCEDLLQMRVYAVHPSCAVTSAHVGALQSPWRYGIDARKSEQSEVVGNAIPIVSLISATPGTFDVNINLCLVAGPLSHWGTLSLDVHAPT